MKCLFKFSIVFVAAIVITGYCIHHPIPDDVPDRSSLQVLANLLAVIEGLAQISEMFGSSNRWWPYNLAIDAGGSMQMLENLEDVHVYTNNIAGVECLFVKPKSLNESRPNPALIYFYGGGFVTGTAASYIPYLVQTAKETGYPVIVSKKSPQYPFPVPFQDALDSTIEIMKRAHEFNIDPDRIAIGGTSAGANLAMSVTLQLTREDFYSGPTPAMLYLDNGFLQMANFRFPSYQHHQSYVLLKNVAPKFFLSYAGLNHRMDLAEIISVNGHIRPETANKLSFLFEEFSLQGTGIMESFDPFFVPLADKRKQFVDEKMRKKLENFILDVRFSPLVASDEELLKLPPTHISVSEYDAVRDDGIVLYKRMTKLKKEVTFQLRRRTLHIASTVAPILSTDYYNQQNTELFNLIKKYLS